MARPKKATHFWIVTAGGMTRYATEADMFAALGKIEHCQDNAVVIEGGEEIQVTPRTGFDIVRGEAAAPSPVRTRKPRTKSAPDGNGKTIKVSVEQDDGSMAPVTE